MNVRGVYLLIARKALLVSLNKSPVTEREVETDDILPSWAKPCQNRISPIH